MIVNNIDNRFKQKKRKKKVLCKHAYDCGGNAYSNEDMNVVYIKMEI